MTEPKPKGFRLKAYALTVFIVGGSVLVVGGEPVYAVIGSILAIGFIELLIRSRR